MSRTIMEVPFCGESEDTVKRIAEKVLTKYKFSKKAFNGEELWMYGNISDEIVSCIACSYGEEFLTLQGFVYDSSINEEYDLNYSYMLKIPKERARKAMEETDSSVRSYAVWQILKADGKLPWYTYVRVYLKGLLNRK